MTTDIELTNLLAEAGISFTIVFDGESGSCPEQPHPMPVAA